MTSSQPTLGVAGLGLIGGSLALAARSSGYAGRCLGWDQDDEVQQRARNLRVVDDCCTSLAELARNCDILVIATPTRAAERLLQRLFDLAGEGMASPIITDVASVKGPLCALAEKAPASVARRFVPGHPIAGSERSGVAAARGDLFLAHRVILTPLPTTDETAMAAVRELWEAAGATIFELAVDEHDAVLARTSHLPHALAFSLVDTLARTERSSDIFRFAAGGFRDFTRIASGDPVMWRDISLANAEALMEAIDDFTADLATLRDAIERGDGEALEDTFRAAKAARDEFATDLSARQRRKPVKRGQ